MAKCYFCVWQLEAAIVIMVVHTTKSKNKDHQLDPKPYLYAYKCVFQLRAPWWIVLQSSPISSIIIFHISHARYLSINFQIAAATVYHRNWRGSILRRKREGDYYYSIQYTKNKKELIWPATVFASQYLIVYRLFKHALMIKCDRKLKGCWFFGQFINFHLVWGWSPMRWERVWSSTHIDY